MFDYEELKQYCLEMQKKGNYREILKDAFEMSFKIDKLNMHRYLINYLIMHFNANPQILLAYMSFPEYADSNKVGISDSGLMKFINELKLKYGLVLSDSQEIVKRPFGLRDMQTSIGREQSHHIVTVSRVDGQTLNLSCTAEDLINLSQTSIQAFITAIDTGAYNLNGNMLSMFKEVLLQANSVIDKMISKEDE